MKKARFFLLVTALAIISLIAVSCSDSNANQGGEEGVTQQESQQIALEYLLQSPTYVFDGIDSSVELVDTMTARCPQCWAFTYEFQSRHAGYGDRTGQMLAQVITDHTARIMIDHGEVKQAVLDDKWNMMTQAEIFTEEASRQIAENLVKTSPTFVFDGIEDTLKLVETLYPDMENAWQFVYEFDSAHAGYGDRTGQMLAQVITSHQAIVTVESGEVVSAIMDQRWDMLQQKEVDTTSGEFSMTAANLLASPVYDETVTIMGKVSLLGELFCPCFELSSGGETIQVWYGLMVEDDGAELPEVSVEGIANGDWVKVTGKLKQAGVHSSLNDFWATQITPVDQSEVSGEPYDATDLIGGTPGSCGYVWDEERGGWHRPWDEDSFIPADEKPEWQDDIPPETTTVVHTPDDDDVIIGGTPGSCGYVWDEGRGGWHRPWDEDSFIPADEKPEWHQYIPCDSDAPGLQDCEWVLVSLGERDDPQAVLENTRVSISFADDGTEGTLSFRGSAGCNSYFGSFEVSGEDLQPGPIAATEMWCVEPEGVMDQETRFLSALGNAHEYQIDEGTLEIHYDTGVLIFAAE